jgi:hypothetical protein
MIESVGFCALYCLIELFDCDASDYEDEDNKDKRMSKEERVKEMNDRFLGRCVSVEVK